MDELLDVSVASTDGGDVATFPGAVNQVLTFRVTNAGNGSESFVLTARDTVGGDDFDPSATSIVIDSNCNGVYDPGIDTVYVDGANNPLLAPDASVLIFVLSSIPAGAADSQRGRVDLVAVAATGSGAPGTTFAGQGEGGGDAVVGATGADAEDDGYYRVSAASVAFVKSADVLDPFGGDEPRAGLDHHLPARRHGLRLGQPCQSAHRRRDSGRLELQAGLDHARGRAAQRRRRCGCGRIYRKRHRRPARHSRSGRGPHRHVPGRDRLKESEMKKFLILLALLLPSVAMAQNQVALTSEIFVERTVPDASGAPRVTLEAPGVVTPGDRLVFVLSYRNNGAAPASDFVVSNPIPKSVSFDGTDSPGALYSVDGGRNWGALAALRVRGADGNPRPATQRRRHRRAMALRPADSGRRRRRIEIQRHRKISLEPAQRRRRGWVMALSTL